MRPGSRGSRATVLAGGQELGELSVPLPGLHNVHNALAALTIGLDLGCTFSGLAGAIATFTGVGRRFQVVGERRGVTVVDDYAHHPTEVEALLRAARQAFPGRRLVVVFQPHLFSRTRRFAEDFGRELARADRVLVAPVYAAREAPIPGVDAALVSGAVNTSGGSAEPVGSLGEAVERLEELLVEGDVLLTVGAGDVDRVGRAWLGEEA